MSLNQNPKAGTHKQIRMHKEKGRERKGEREWERVTEHCKYRPT
jgi:hypothetical protein